MSHEQRATARSFISKGDLTRTPAQQREDFDAVFGDRPLGDDVTLTPRTLGGVPALDVTVEGADGDAVILYLHGGGYAIGRPAPEPTSRHRSRARFCGNGRIR